MTPDARHQQIIRLLETRDDNLPLTQRRDQPRRGFIHGQEHREPCEDCIANDRILKSCETCGGSGYTIVYRDRDPYAIDKVQPYGLEQTRHEKTRERDAQIAHLEAQLLPPHKTPADELAHANAHPYPWEIERRRMYRQYDYAALDRALDALRHVDQGAYHALHATYIYAWADLSAGYEAAVQRGFSYLDQHLPNPLRAPGEHAHPAVDRRNNRRSAP